MQIELPGDFDHTAAAEIRSQLAAHDPLEVDLQNSRFVDSEALMLLCELCREGRDVQLFHAPPLYFEAVEVLGLTDILKDITGANDR
jgi:ABC-type transporter Mla MlaB component